MSRERPIRNSKLVALLLKYFARAHIWVYQRTNGRLGAKLLWFPAALLTTVGRKSGQHRITATLCLRDGNRVVLPASFGGRDRDPLWYLNLKSNPKVHLQIRGEHLDMTAGRDRRGAAPLLAAADQDVPAVQGLPGRDRSGDPARGVRAHRRLGAEDRQWGA